MEAEIKDLLGKKLTDIQRDGEQLIFVVDDGSKYRLYHSQDCCENVSIDDINGDLSDLIGSPILMAEQVSNESFEADWEAKFKDGEYGKEGINGEYYPDSHTWTFYKLATIKGYVNIRWFGESNGYYSEGVSFEKADEEGNFDRW